MSDDNGGTWRIWDEPAEIRCTWKDALPESSVCIEDTGTVFAFGVAVAACPDRKLAERVVAAVNGEATLRTALDQARAEVESARKIIGYVSECEGGAAMLEEARHIGWVRQDDLREEVAELRAQLAAMQAAVTAAKGVADRFEDRPLTSRTPEQRLEELEEWLDEYLPPLRAALDTGKESR